MTLHPQLGAPRRGAALPVRLYPKLLTERLIGPLAVSVDSQAFKAWRRLLPTPVMLRENAIAKKLILSWSASDLAQVRLGLKSFDFPQVVVIASDRELTDWAGPGILAFDECLRSI